MRRNPTTTESKPRAGYTSLIFTTKFLTKFAGDFVVIYIFVV